MPVYSDGAENPEPLTPAEVAELGDAITQLDACAAANTDPFEAELAKHIEANTMKHRFLRLQACAATGATPDPRDEADQAQLAKKHRDKNTTPMFPYSALVAEPVSRKEAGKIPLAVTAAAAEWQRLRERGTWD